MRHAAPPSSRPSPWPRAGTAALLLALGLAASTAAGWAGQAWWRAQQDAAALAAHQAAARAAGRDPQVPDYVRDASLAHALYLPELRHPVEASLDADGHLFEWLSQRLGTPLQTPSLHDYGWKLLGGRLLPAGDDPRPGAPLARALFMYENGRGERVTLYASPRAAVAASPAGATVAPTAPAAPSSGLRLARRTGIGTGGIGTPGPTTLSLYWSDAHHAYALSGNIEEKRLRALADLAQARIGMAARPARAGSAS